eukprot:4628365-Pleurochrysis_carterae.AAC.1
MQVVARVSAQVSCTYLATRMHEICHLRAETRSREFADVVPCMRGRMFVCMHRVGRHILVSAAAERGSAHRREHRALCARRLASTFSERNVSSDDDFWMTKLTMNALIPACCSHAQ